MMPGSTTGTLVLVTGSKNNIPGVAAGAVTFFIFQNNRTFLIFKFYCYN